MDRAIIQIAATECGAENGYSRHLFALANDGTVWEMDRSHAEIVWKQVPVLPQPVLDDNKPF